MSQSPSLLSRHLPYLLIVLLVLTAAAAAEDFSSLNLWNSGHEGYATYRIPGILITKKGTVLAYAAARRTLGSDWATTDIVLRRSTDNGHTFSASTRIAGADNLTTDNPTAVADMQTGAIYLLYQTNYERCFVITSTNDGISFSTPHEITSALLPLRTQFNWNVIAPGPTHGIQLRIGIYTGRIVVPLWMATGTLRPDGTRTHAPSAVTTIYSDDHARSWHAGEIVLANGPQNDSQMKNPSETTIAQLADGRVMLNLRNESAHNRRLISTSSDGATNWSHPMYDENLFEPICAAGLVRYPAHAGAPTALLFSNPDSQSLPSKNNHYPRQRLTVRASFDEGRTWPAAKLLDPGITGYSDLAVLPDGTILCLYESGGISGLAGDPVHLTLASFTLQWLLSH
jgi:sialidase-1